MKLSKSKLALAKVINENGGWVDGAEWAAQDKHGASYKLKVWFYSGKEKPYTGKGCTTWQTDYKIHDMDAIQCDKLLPNWHQTCLSREEYYHAYQKADADGWVEWNGGECPVCGDDDVDVVLVDGSNDHGIADEFDWHRDSGPLSVASYRLRNTDAGAWLNWDGGECPVGDGVLIDVKKVDGSTEFAVHDPQDRIWSDLEHRKCITAYRLHKPEAKPEFCESAMRSIPDTESNHTIEQLAQEYRNAKEYAVRLQKEAGEANAKADEALGNLERAGEALGLLIAIAKQEPEPELVITDWWDLLERDVIWFGGDDEQAAGEYSVLEVENGDYGGRRSVRIDTIGSDYWIDVTDDWEFIRRP